MTDLTGNENRNRTQFKSCRQYSGESVLTFAEAPAGEAEPAQSVEKRVVVVPYGLSLEVSLGTEIDSSSSAVGDPVIARLISPIKNKRELLFAKGSIVSGRIVKLERHSDRSAIDILFSKIESPDQRSALLARVEELILPLNAPAVRPPFAANQPAPATGVYLRGNQFHLSQGVRLRLRTMAVAQPQH